MKVDAECPRCNMGDKSNGHALFVCEKSWIFWMNSPFSELCDRVKYLDFASVIQLANDELERFDLECQWGLRFCVTK